MRQTWRWFGPPDHVSIDDMMQAGVEGVVSALHHVPTGEVWTPGEIAKRQQAIGRMKDGNPSGLRWDIVESLPVSENIKKQRGNWRAHVENYKASLENLAAAGISMLGEQTQLDGRRAVALRLGQHADVCHRGPVYHRNFPVDGL